MVIDLHCHVLPGLDDGAADLADAVAMGRQADADGVTTICSTPHVRRDHLLVPPHPESVSQLNQTFAAAGVRARVLPGAELASDMVPLCDADSLRACALGGGGLWVLLEPAPGPIGDDLEEAVGHLAAQGFLTLIAHPERHLASDLIPRLRELNARHGALVQATAAFFTDPASADGMLTLARAGVIHVLGSDAHSSRAGRPVALRTALDALAAVPMLAPHRDWIAHAAPRAIIEGRSVRPPW